MKKFLFLSAFAVLISACSTGDEEPVLYLQEPEDIQVSSGYEYVIDDDRAFGVEVMDPARVRKKVFFEQNITPDIYERVARRTVNKMLDETASLYDADDETPTIFIRSVKVEDDLLPDGFFYANRMTKKLLENSKTFKISNDRNEADYFLETEVDTVEFENSDTPVIVYKILLLNQKSGIIQEWSENIRQVRNDDRSWW